LARSMRCERICWDGDIPLIVRHAIAILEESKGPAAGVSFFLVLFLSLRLPVEMWEIPEAVTAGPGYESIPQPGDGYEETFGSGPSWKRNACSDVVLRGLGYKGCGVFLASGIGE
jgi:hypothetical protein